MKEEKLNSSSRTTFGGANIENGVYVVYKDGHYVKSADVVAAGKPPYAVDVAFVGLAYDGHTFGVHLCGSKGHFPLINTPGHTAPKDDLCFENEWDALMEWDFVKHTRHIQKIGTDIPLEEGEYLPTLACLMVMFHYQEQLNETLEFVGGKPIDFGTNFWSCLRRGSYAAWNAYGRGGFFSSGYMFIKYAAVPLSLWNPA